MDFESFIQNPPEQDLTEEQAICLAGDFGADAVGVVELPDETEDGETLLYSCLLFFETGEDEKGTLQIWSILKDPDEDDQWQIRNLGAAENGDPRAITLEYLKKTHETLSAEQTSSVPDIDPPPSKRQRIQTGRVISLDS